MSAEAPYPQLHTMSGRQTSVLLLLLLHPLMLINDRSDLRGGGMLGSSTSGGNSVSRSSCASSGSRGGRVLLSFLCTSKATSATVPTIQLLHLIRPELTIPVESLVHRFIHRRLHTIRLLIRKILVEMRTPGSLEWSAGFGDDFVGVRYTSSSISYRPHHSQNQGLPLLTCVRASSRRMCMRPSSC